MTLQRKISDLMDLLEDESVPLRDAGIASPERIKEATMKKLHDTSHPRRARRYRAALIAAAAVLALSAGALAAWHFGLGDLAGPEVTANGETRQTLVLGGLAGSPEYAAAREWEDQLSAWFQKGENLAEAGEDPEADAYYQAGAHSPEAREALDALLERYGLALHNGFGEYRSLDALYAAAGESDFLPAPGADGTGPAFARLYDDGTLTCTASAALPDGGAVDYDLYSLKKGTFTRTGYLLADAADLESWTMTAADGTELLLALGGEKAILAADGAECFVFVNFRGGTDSAPALDRDALETLAAEFDLAALRALAQG
jgi:hypothetical protein